MKNRIMERKKKEKIKFHSNINLKLESFIDRLSGVENIFQPKTVTTAANTW